MHLPLQQPQADCEAHERPVATSTSTKSTKCEAYVRPVATGTSTESTDCSTESTDCEAHGRPVEQKVVTMYEEINSISLVLKHLIIDGVALK